MNGLVLICSLGVEDIAKALVARAQSAADATALAVAQELALPSGRDPASVGLEYAEHDGATLLSCSCSAGTYEDTVEVEVPVGALLLLPDDRTVVAWVRAIVDLPGTPQP